MRGFAKKPLQTLNGPYRNTSLLMFTPGEYVVSVECFCCLAGGGGSLIEINVVVDFMRVSYWDEATASPCDTLFVATVY